MKPHIFIALLALFCGVAHSQAQGTLQITFDGSPAIPPGADIAVTNYYESGILFRPLPGSRVFGRVGPGFPSDPQNGTAYLSAASTDSLTFGFTNGSVFNLVSIDLAEYSTGFQNPLTVHLIGYRFDGSTVTTDLTTDGIIDGTGPQADFQTFNFGRAFSGLTRVEIPTSLWSLDNLVVSIPEPAAFLLLPVGGLLLWALTRRHRNS